MRKFGLIVAGAAGLVGSLLSGQAYACATFGASGIGSESDAMLSAAGACVTVGDKTFSGFTFGNLNQDGGTVLFTPNPSPPLPSGLGSYGVSFLNAIPANTTVLNFGFTTVVTPTTPQVNFIDDLETDFTLQADPLGSPASATLSATSNTLFTPDPLTCTRTVNQAPGNCPGASIAPNPADDVLTMTVRDSLTTLANTEVSAVVDTVTEDRHVPVPEPASLILLGSALVGFGWFARRRGKRA